MSNSRPTHKEIRVGDRIGKLVVLEETEPYICGSCTKRRFLCRCDCGKNTIVRIDHLRKGTKSCGCYSTELINAFNRTHKLSHTRIYNIYRGMLNRCYKTSHKSFNDYGGRGIEVCSEWQGEDGANHFFEWAFSHGYNDSLTIDRIDNSKGYSPDNCRWATMKEQSNNRRSNLIVIFNGQEKTISEWAETYQLSYMALWKRLKSGWDIEKALTTPVRRRMRNA